jgi:hypothetical protein
MEIWEKVLKDNGWNICANYQHNGTFLFAFQSTWQREMMLRQGSNMLMLDTIYNSTNNYFLSNGNKISLWTFMIRDHITGKCLLVFYSICGQVSIFQLISLTLSSWLFISSADYSLTQRSYISNPLLATQINRHLAPLNYE